MQTNGSGHVQSSDWPIVGVGSSAGGITALQSLFEAIPAASNLTFVVIQHLPPGRSTGLD